MFILPRRKRCKYCGELFIPDPHVKGHQIACKKAGCQRTRKKESQNKWFLKNRDYFKGRYANTRQWLDCHPQYLKTYRESHPEYVKKNRLRQKQRRRRPNSAGVDIQDEIIAQHPGVQSDRTGLIHVDIQDAIWPQLVVPIGVNNVLARVDIQDNIYKLPFSRYSGIRIKYLVSNQRIYAIPEASLGRRL